MHPNGRRQAYAVAFLGDVLTSGGEVSEKESFPTEALCRFISRELLSSVLQDRSFTCRIHTVIVHVWRGYG